MASWLTINWLTNHLNRVRTKQRHSDQAKQPAWPYTSALYAFIKMKIIIIFTALIPVLCMADDIPEVRDINLDRPVWALNMNDAKWLVPNKELTDSNKFAFFSFSNEKTNMSDKPIEQREDNSGRTTRSLPLYLAERINLDTDCSAENHVFVVKNFGPVVSGKEWDIETLSGLFKEEIPRYFVTGHIKQDYLDLRSKITVKVWDSKLKREIINISNSSLFSESQDTASALPMKFLGAIKKDGLCKFSPSIKYPAPSKKLLAPYLDALGQLLVQTLAENKVVPAESIWGEEDMLNWYLTLWEHQPESDAPKLMYIRGVLASLDYGGIGKEKFVPGLREYLRKSEGNNDVLQMLSPYIYSKLKNSVACEMQLKELKKKAAGSYASWLNSLECKTYNESLNLTGARNAPPSKFKH